MYKVAIPVSLTTLLNEESFPRYLDDVRRCGAQRVFICGIGNIYMKTGRNYTEPEAIRKVVDYYHQAGIEVGIWLPSLGNGHALTAVQGITDDEEKYTQITGINGEARKHLSCCPLDRNFVKAYCDGIRSVAGFHPDLIMLDDDFRFNNRIGIHFACFCPLHLQEFYKRIGEEIPREELESRILTGGKNKYRSEILKLFGETLLGFAKEIRAAVDEVDPKIRVGVCTHETWDLHGTDPLEIAKALAGNTKPFARISGAPFRDDNVIPVIEFSRQQYAWAKGSDVELFSEGDTFPRPRSRVASKPLELFELVLRADGSSDGILAYLEDYGSRYDYERGYVERFVRNGKLRCELVDLFKGKSPVGVEVFSVAHKAENWELPGKLDPKAAEMLIHATNAPSYDVLSENSIPTCFGQNGEYPVLIMGENARYADFDRLKNGALLDVPAARILSARGVDTGLIEVQPPLIGERVWKEYFVDQKDDVEDFASAAAYQIKCSKNAKVLSMFETGGTPSSYRYENAAGQKFYVLAFDLYKFRESSHWKHFLCSYYRQADLVSAIEWMAGKRLPVFSARHPRLYTLASKRDDAMSVMLANVHLDDVLAPEIQLDKCYSKIRFLNCSGRLEKDKVHLSDIPPYGMAAFEVR